LKFRSAIGKYFKFSRSSLIYSLTLGSVTLATFWIYCCFNRTQSQSQSIPKLPQDPAIAVYFNQAQSGNFKEPYRQKTRQGDDLAVEIIKSIDLATTTIDIAVQQFQLPNVAQALVSKAKTGVKVRVILENNYSQPWSELSQSDVASLSPREQDRYREFERLVDIDRNGKLEPAEISQRDALIILRQGNVPIIDDTADGSKGSGLMHHKFMVVDGSKTIVTSANWTLSDIYGDLAQPESVGNQNNLVQLDSPEIAQLFTAEFNQMWGDGVGGSNDSLFGSRKVYRPPSTIMVGTTPVTIQFSPTSSQQDWAVSTNGTIARFLNTSQQQIDFALFVFSEDRLGDILVDRGMQGIKIRGSIDRQFADRDYSQRLKLMGCKSGSKMVANIAVPNLPAGDILHHKFAVIDRKTVITGSHNWSAAANYINDEAVIMIENNPTIAAHFNREFDRLNQGAAAGISAKVCQP
jgi:phosphatidylserine/phosphatidylglycerophosphate/cardiolipin synthase-like enzyme